MQIKEIILQTHLINELKNFYHKLPGLKITNESSDSFKIHAGKSEIQFIQTSLSENEKPFYHFAFNIPENQFKEAKEWILAKTQTLKLNGSDEFDFKSWNAHSAYFYDPAGNIVELIARHNLKNSANNAFSGRSLLCISEIGIPVNDIIEFRSGLTSEDLFPVFSGDNETFSAVGDEEGLLILVKKGRKWYPDCPEARIFPIIIKIISEEDSEINFEDINCKIFFYKRD
jgi:catechol-2,3-dioxygenase